jgi:hypothetical protein
MHDGSYLPPKLPAADLTAATAIPVTFLAAPTATLAAASSLSLFLVPAGGAVFRISNPTFFEFYITLRFLGGKDRLVMA